MSFNPVFTTVVSERKLTKTVISSKARNLIVLKIQALKISPYGRNDKKRGFRSGTTVDGTILK